MRYHELEVVADVSERLGDMELFRAVFTAGIFSAQGFGTSWWLLWYNISSLLKSVDDALEVVNVHTLREVPFKNLRNSRRKIVGLFALANSNTIHFACS